MKRLLFLLAVLLVATSTLGQQCDASLWGHTYHKQRFTVIATCKCFDGVLTWKKPEKDGDFHMRLKLDAGQGHPLNHANMTKQAGALVVEPICEHKISQADVGNACVGARKVDVPPLGSHVRVCGVYARDDPHSWIELHGVTFQKLSQ